MALTEISYPGVPDNGWKWVGKHTLSDRRNKNRKDVIKPFTVLMKIL